MALTSREISFLQDLVAKGSGQKSASLSSRHFAQHFGIGHHVGLQFVFGDRDSDKARQILRNAGVAVEGPTVPLRRANAGLNNPAFEKTGTLAPHHDSVVVKAAHGRCTGSNFQVPTIGYQVLTLEQARGIQADALLVVENLETLRFLERNRWIDYRGKNVLAVFRGDNLFTGDSVLKLLDARDTPVWAYFDFDPAGLGLAAKLPRLQRLLLPPESELERAARKFSQVHLYADQADQWGKSLTADTRPMIQEPWLLMRRLRLGLAQELMDLV